MKNGGGGKLNHSLAFTLAEVLITLGIIGIVAAMTMPTLIQKHQEKVTVTKLKKAYSIISQAYLRAQNEYGDINNWGFKASSSGDRDEETGLFPDHVYNNAEIYWSKLIPYLGVTSTCNNKGNNCPIPGQYNLDGTNRDKIISTSLIKLKDGMVFMGSWMENIYCEKGICGDFAVDINGPNTPPNTIGKDVFYFYVYKNKIVPMGHKAAANGSRTFEKDCINGGNGYGCTAWVIYNENMDYLHCNDLSWDGKKKCK